MTLFALCSPSSSHDWRYRGNVIRHGDSRKSEGVSDSRAGGEAERARRLRPNMRAGLRACPSAVNSESSRVSRTSCPVTDARVNSSMACPVATTRPSTVSTAPTSGTPSGEHGRSPTHGSEETAPEERLGFHPACLTVAARRQSGRVLTPTSSSVPANRVRLSSGVATTRSSCSNTGTSNAGGPDTSTEYPRPASLAASHRDLL